MERSLPSRSTNGERQGTNRVFPGSNCDRDVKTAIERVTGFAPKMVWHGDASVPSSDVIVLPGGFSYGDYLRSGAIARFSPIMEQVIKHAENGGFVFGVCNGFQILCESGLLPGAVLHNNSRKFICKNVYIKAQTNQTVLTASVPDKALKIPIAHGEGKYYADAETIAALNKNGQVIFRYCDEKGNIDPLYNVNGAIRNIAGIKNKQGNVFGMMPHPERASNKFLGNTDGLEVFRIFGMN